MQLEIVTIEEGMERLFAVLGDGETLRFTRLFGHPRLLLGELAVIRNGQVIARARIDHANGYDSPDVDFHGLGDALGKKTADLPFVSARDLRLGDSLRLLVPGEHSILDLLREEYRQRTGHEPGQNQRTFVF